MPEHASRDDFAAAHPAIGPDVKDALGVPNAVNAFRSYGSTAPAEVAAQLVLWKQRLSADVPSDDAAPDR